MALPQPHRQPGFPACVHLTITFNDHAVIYKTAEEWDADEFGGQGVSWASEDEHATAIATDRVWTCQWYPITPVGSYTAAASSFEALMAYVNAQAQS